MNAAYMLPPLQPTTRSTPMPSRFSTFWRPRAAAHLTLPAPMTSAMRRFEGAAVPATGPSTETTAPRPLFSTTIRIVPSSPILERDDLLHHPQAIPVLRVRVVFEPVDELLDHVPAEASGAALARRGIEPRERSVI